MATWKNEFDPNPILDSLKDIISFNSTGGISFKGPYFEDYLLILIFFLKFDYKFHEIEQRQIVTKALFNLGKKSLLSPVNLKNEINKLENSYLKKPLKRFVLFTNLSLKIPNNLIKSRMFGSTIVLDSNYPKIYNRQKIESNYKEFKKSNLPTNYTYVKVFLKAKSELEAGNKALEIIDLWRSIWNLYYNRKRITRNGFRNSVQVNNILLGPLHTLHHTNGKLASTLYWYQPNYISPIKCIDVSKDLVSLKNFEKQIRFKISKSIHKDMLINVLQRYTQALDERNFNSSYLRLWSLLESLSFTHENESLEKTIKRVSFIYKNHNLHFQILRHLKEYRNKFVHQDESSEFSEKLLYQLKGYVESMIIFQLNNKMTIEDTRSFLDASKDIYTIKKKIKFLQKVLHFRNV